MKIINTYCNSIFMLSYYTFYKLNNYYKYKNVRFERQQTISTLQIVTGTHSTDFLLLKFRCTTGRSENIQERHQMVHLPSTSFTYKEFKWENIVEASINPRAKLKNSQCSRSIRFFIELATMSSVTTNVLN